MELLLDGVKDKWRGLLLSPSVRPKLEMCIEKMNEKAAAGRITPKQEDVFRCFKMFDAPEMKAIILGLDPYPGVDEADGLCFSSKKGMQGSSRNVFKCLVHNGILTGIPKSSDLTEWAKRGVLMLNMYLTRDLGSGKSGEHPFWKELTSEILVQISSRVKSKDIYVMMWGNEVMSMREYLSGRLIPLTWNHPSPISTYNNNISNPKHFSHCDHFNIVDCVDWSLDVERDETADFAGNIVAVATDGSCKGNGKTGARGGFAAYFPATYAQQPNMWSGDVSGPVLPYVMRLEGTEIICTQESVPPTNNRAELLGIIYALKVIAEANTEIDNVVFVIDSDYAINLLRDCSVPRTYGRKPNLDLILIMRELYGKCQVKNIHIIHQYSHTGGSSENEVINNIADKLAQEKAGGGEITFNIW
jgi:uracil-DNA glycosylase